MADTKQKLDGSFLEIAQTLELASGSDTADPVRVRESVKEWLSNPVASFRENASRPSNKSLASWLLVFDNADDLDILRDYWPKKCTGSVLVTSRESMTNERAYSGGTCITLSPMALEEAGQLLLQLTGQPNNAKNMQLSQQISEILGGLPLAISQMAAIIRRKHLSLGEFLEYYGEDAGKLQSMHVPGLTHPQTVASVWAFEGLNPPALVLLKVISLLDADRVQEELLMKGSKSCGLKEYPESKSDYFDAREELIKSSLLSKHKEQETTFLRIHRLVQDVVRRRMATDELRSILNGTARLLLAVWPSLTNESLQDLSSTARRNIATRYFPHLAYFRKLFEKIIRDRDLLPSTDVAKLFNEASW